MTEPAPSPFLPGTHIQLGWDSTSLGYLKTCPRLYQYIMIEGWQTPEESVHLRFGIEYHAALQDYDLSRAAGIAHNEAVHDVVRELLIRTADYDPDHKTKTREGLVRTVIWYLDQFVDDSAKTLILSDGTPAVEQSFRFELDWGPITSSPDSLSGAPLTYHYVLCGHLDRVVTFSGDLFVMDRKTTGSTPGEWFFSQFDPDNQMSLYTIASKVVLDAPVKGVIIDAAQIGDAYSNFGRGFSFRTPEQSEEWLADLRYWLTLAEQFALAQHWPMNDKSCNSYRSEKSEKIGCEFRSICSKSPSVRGRFLEGNFIKLKEEDKWNPLKTR